MLVSNEVCKVVVHLKNGSTKEYEGPGSLVANSTPVGSSTPSSRAWADGTAPRIDQVMVSVMTRDDR